MKNRDRRLLEQKERYKANKDRYKIAADQWTKNNPEKVHAIGKRFRSKPGYKQYNTDRSRAYYALNKKRLRKRRREYLALHPELRKKRNADNREWYRKNPLKHKLLCDKRRALKKSATVNLASIVAWQTRVKSKPSFVCYYCENRKPIGDLHFDHIIPLVKGGPHSVENLCTSCSWCNLSKNKNVIGAWYKAGQLILGL